MQTRCPSCRTGDLRKTLARMMMRCARCAWEGFPNEGPSELRRIPPRRAT